MSSSLRRMSSQENCIAVNRLHRFRSRPWGAKPFPRNVLPAVLKRHVHEKVEEYKRAIVRRTKGHYEPASGD